MRKVDIIKSEIVSWSMQPLISKGDEVTVIPYNSANIKIGDIVFFKIKKPFEIWIGKKHKKLNHITHRIVGKKKINGEEYPANEIPLLYLSLGDKNRFNSNVIPFKHSDGDYSEFREGTFQMSLNVLVSQFGETNIKSERREKVIDDIKFESLAIKIYSADETVLLGRWELYDALVNGWAFSMNYTCSDEEAWISIINAIENSKFADIK